MLPTKTSLSCDKSVIDTFPSRFKSPAFKYGSFNNVACTTCNLSCDKSVVVTTPSPFTSPFTIIVYSSPDSVFTVEPVPTLPDVIVFPSLSNITNSPPPIKLSFIAFVYFIFV